MAVPTQNTIELPGKVKEAYNRIRKYIWKTPLMYSSYLSKSANVYLKLESEQLTGSFKARGAFNKILHLHETEPAKLNKGFITASSGNHGLACVEAAKVCQCPLEIFSRVGITEAKLDALQAEGASVTLYGEDCVEAEVKARQTAEEQGLIYLSPYNDWDVVAGQGTVGLEIHEELPAVDYVLVAVGGGGLISGVASYLKHVNKNIQIVGCQPSNSKVMYESVKAGKLVHEESLETLSDGTTGDVEDGSITFPLCRDHVDSWILVNEEQISEAVYFMLNKHHKVVEGSAGVAIAAYMNNKQMFEGKNVVIVVCGANISVEELKKIIDANSNK